MLNVPILALAVKFSLISKVTTPLPVPESGDVIEIQASLAVTSQEHPFAEFTLTDPLPLCPRRTGSKTRASSDQSLTRLWLRYCC